MRVLVCGGRDYKDVDAVYMVLDGLKERPTVIIHGCASGADSIAAMWAEERGVPVDPYPAEWEDLSHPDAIVKTRRDGRQYDARAGFRRNLRMIIEGKPDLVIAFPGGSGTKNMKEVAAQASIPIMDAIAALRAFDILRIARMNEG